MASVTRVIETSVDTLVSETMPVTSATSEVVDVGTEIVVISDVTVVGSGSRQRHASDIGAAARLRRFGSVKSMQLLEGSMHTGPPQWGSGSGLLASRSRLVGGREVVSVVDVDVVVC